MIAVRITGSHRAPQARRRRPLFRGRCGVGMVMLLWLAAMIGPPRSLGAQPAAAPARTSTEAVAIAQSAPTGAAPAARSVDGRVIRPVATGGDSAGMGPVVGAWVTLHRVGKDSAGPIDSMRTDKAGGYRMQWRTSGAADAVYFASVTWGGIAYFTPPLRDANVRGEGAEITVFDTTTRIFPLSVKGRHLIVGMLDSAEMRTVIEVFELSNDSTRTIVTADGASPTPTWSLAIPKAAQDVRVTEGEISPESFAYADGRVSIFAPIAPGLKQLAFSYKLPANSFPITFRAEDGAVVFEVLLEDAQGTVFGQGFAAVDPVTLENRNFRRFLAQDFKPRGEVTIELPLVRSPGRKLYIAGIFVAVGFLLLLLLSRVMQRRTAQGAVALTSSRVLQQKVSARLPEIPLSDRLAQEIAALDAVFAKQADPSESVREAYAARRQELKDALADALASTPNGR